MKKIVNVMNYGLYEVSVYNNNVYLNPAFLETFDGEFWELIVDREEEEPLEVPEGVNADDLSEVMECVVLPYLGCSSDESWMDIA